MGLSCSKLEAEAAVDIQKMQPVIDKIKQDLQPALDQMESRIIKSIEAVIIAKLNDLDK